MSDATERRSLREEWRSRTRYGKVFVPFLAVVRLFELLVLLVFLVCLGVLALLFVGPKLLLDRVESWVKQRTPAVYRDDADQPHRE